jgi:hypothetical protein
MPLSEAQQKNYEFFQRELPKFLENPLIKGKFVTIHGEKIQMANDSFENAYHYALAHFSSTEFIIHEVFDERDRINFIMGAVK